MSRFWPDGIAVVVEASFDAAPQAFAWEQHQHTVETVVRRWRRDVGWWKRRTWREYFIVRTQRGLLLELYHDVASGAWAVQRVFD